MSRDSGGSGEVPVKEFRSKTRWIVDAWFALTRDEQKALAVVLGLLLLGLCVRCWHQRQTNPALPPPTQAATVVTP